MQLMMRWLIVGVVAVMLTACGGGGASTELTAIQQIASYARDGGTAPTVDVYQDAGVTGVTADNLDAINAVVAELEYEDVDTPDELQALIDSLGADTRAPEFTSPATVSVAENQTAAVTLAATDASPVTYSISGGDSDAFDVDSVTGVVTFKTAPDYESKASYTFTAIATDAEGNSATQDVTITVTDVVEPFITVWETNATDFNITIPTDSDYTYNYTIDWGDGEIEEEVAGDATHTYSSEGNWTVKISGEFPHLLMKKDPNTSTNEEKNNAYQLLKVTAWGDIKWKDMTWMFAHCDRFNIEASDKPILKDVEKMWDMFYYAKSMNAPIGDWDVSNVKYMLDMFYEASSFNQPIGDWNVSNVISMSMMFYHSTAFNQDLSNWDTSSVTDMSYMFYNATSFKDQDLSSWDVANVTDHTEFATNSGGNIIEPNWP